MSELTLMDVVVLLLFAISIPLLVDNYLKKGRFSAEVKFVIILGGLFWLVFAFFAETLSGDLLGVPMLDAWGHKWHGENLALSMNQGSWAPFWEHFRTGNHAYQCYVAWGLNLFGPHAQCMVLFLGRTDSGQSFQRNVPVCDEP